MKQAWLQLWLRNGTEPDRRPEAPMLIGLRVQIDWKCNDFEPSYLYIILLGSFPSAIEEEGNGVEHNKGPLQLQKQNCAILLSISLAYMGWAEDSIVQDLNKFT